MVGVVGEGLCTHVYRAWASSSFPRFYPRQPEDSTHSVWNFYRFFQRRCKPEEVDYCLDRA